MEDILRRIAETNEMIHRRESARFWRGVVNGTVASFVLLDVLLVLYRLGVLS